ncbi:Hypothetical protein PHPALM_5948 [Phytophthora palmivora]|uniref:Uncharacterized protein n=1 Tax=Phytophthora palmivora TaxID=4796 RepID=A0A2P4YG39_9STRA|nr:Hypothetical protein PHPALM_5948 [Phytophthora palmivora]
MCVIPAGLTPYLQAGDIRIYTSFKDLFYLDWHITRHDIYGKKFREKWETLTEGEQDEFDFNLDNLHDASDDIAQIGE